jgi:adenine/guanine/hypoxanthine permease
MIHFIKNLVSSVTSFFELDARNTSFLQEFRAGTATFLTMSYILLVNPQLLAKLGVTSTDIVISTALSASIGSLLAGIYGNFPFGLASGVGLSAYLTYGLVLGEGFTVPEAFTSVSNNNTELFLISEDKCVDAVLIINQCLRSVSWQESFYLRSL